VAAFEKLDAVLNCEPIRRECRAKAERVLGIRFRPPETCAQRDVVPSIQL
jgi:hypothetical protein